MFIDEAKIHVAGGDGGNGCVAFRRERFVPRGGPSGGDGGRGGNVYLQSSEHVNTLLKFRYKREFVAGRGRHGEGSNRHGQDGEDLMVELPVGTIVYNDATAEKLWDFDAHGQRFLAARGGRGTRRGDPRKRIACVRWGRRRPGPGDDSEGMSLKLQHRPEPSMGSGPRRHSFRSLLIRRTWRDSD